MLRRGLVAGLLAAPALAAAGHLMPSAPTHRLVRHARLGFMRYATAAEEAAAIAREVAGFAWPFQEGRTPLRWYQPVAARDAGAWVEELPEPVWLPFSERFLPRDACEPFLFSLRHRVRLGTGERLTDLLDLAGRAAT